MVETDFSNKVGKQLQSLRKAAGFKSARVFAEHIGYSPSAYTEYEQGRRMFTYEQAWDFADALNCTLDELGGRKPPERTYRDPLQASLNASYENMNDKARETLEAVAKSMERDTVNRIVKDRQDCDGKATKIGA